jgi:orotidine-5'-phosphate decarboxylase
MSALNNLQKIQQKNRTLICLGLDLDPKKMPSEFAGSIKGMFDFAHRIIDATSDLVCAYKPNLAFYEALGAEGLSLLKLIRDRIPEEVPVIMDGKRGDIGNTAQYYAESLFDKLRADWVTLSPYMGFDSLRPFLEYKEKGAFILCLTSNAGSKDFQLLDVGGKPLYTVVAERVNSWNKEQNCGLVVGATHPDQLREIREIAGEMPLLIPGVGAQGGSLEEAATLGTNGFQKPAVINVSRSVLYASADKDFAQRARQELERLNAAVNLLRAGRGPTVTPSQPTAEQPAAVPDQPATVPDQPAATEPPPAQ